MSATAPSAGNKLFVIDAMPLLYRGHFVFLRKPRLTSSGINTSALTGFAASVLQILEEHHPSHAVLVFDSRTPTFRHERFPEYKAKREKIPEDLAAAIPMALELAAALRIPSLRVDGFEADDLMGTLAALAEGQGFVTYLATPDKDIAQLVDPQTLLYRPGKPQAPAEVYGVEEVCRTWGLSSPRQMVDLLGLAGDASDNIPGVRGVGEKTAQTLLAKYGSLEAVLAASGELKGKLGERITADREVALLSRELATVRRDVPLPVSLDDLRRNEPDPEALRTVLAKYELVQMGRRLLGEAFEVRASTRHATLATSDHRYICAACEADLAALLDALAHEPVWSFDAQTDSLDPWRAQLHGLAFATAPGSAWYVPLPREADAARQLLQRFQDIFRQPGHTRVGHNTQFDVTVLRRHGIEVGTRCDTLLTHYVLDAADRHGMDHLARQYLDYDPIPLEQLLGSKGAGQLSLSDLTAAQVCDYACETADLTLRLHHHLRPQAAQAGAVMALERSEEPLVDVLIDMEEQGVRIDPEALRTYGHELDRELLDLETRILEMGGGGFNIGSPRQLGEVLFDRLKLDPDAARTTSGQYATNEDVLQRMAGAHPIVSLILEHRACSKLKSTYVDKLPASIDPATGRVHTHFSQALTETGRLASSDPNLQNIPIRTKRGRRIRAAFVPRDADHILLSADYSQVELRVMAALSGDRGLLAAFQRGADIHTETAAAVFDVMPALVTSEMRSRCKMVNFGIIYGISPFGLGQRLGIPRRQAGELIDAYFAQYPGVKAYMDRTIEEARQNGFVKTVLGRRRHLRDINSRNGTARQAAERNAINTPVQGTAADLIKLAMVRVHAELREARLGTRMVLQVHDELLFDVPRHEEAAVRRIVSAAMTQALDLGVPLEVEMGTGDNWLEAH